MRRLGGEHLPLVAFHRNHARPVTRYLARRLGASLITALLASLLVFLIVRQVPGDVVAQMLGQTSDPVAEQAMRRFFGIDEPL